MGHRCYRVSSFWLEIISVPNIGSVQQGYYQLHNFGAPVLSMVTTMSEQAFAAIPDGTGLILHSDQGWQYQHKKYQRMLEQKGIIQSMSHMGNCYDNAGMENFFGHLKSELLYLQEFESM